MLALADLRAALAGPAGWGRGEQVGIEPQTGDQADVATHRGDQFEAGEAAVADNGDGALGQPAPGLQDRLDGPAGQRLVAPAAFSAGALRGREDGQERQCPAPLRPWD